MLIYKTGFPPLGQEIVLKEFRWIRRGGPGRSHGLFTVYFGMGMLNEWWLHSLDKGGRAGFGGKMQVKL